MKTARQRGVVLIVVLWITVLLTVLLVAFTASIKVDRNVATDIVQRVQARAGAEAVLNYLVAIRQSEAHAFSRMVGEVYKLSLNAMDVRFRLIPESAFISLNAASLEDLTAAFNAVDAENAAEIAQYVVQRRTGVLESDISVDPGMSSPRPWISIIELATVPIITADVYQRVQGWLTVDSDIQEVNLDFADVYLVHALKGTAVEHILAQRAVANKPQTNDDDIFRVQVELSSSSSTRQIEAVVMFSSGEHGYHVVRWNEYNTHFYLD